MCVVPWQEQLWVLDEVFRISGQEQEPRVGVDLVEAAGVDQAHETIPDFGSAFGFIMVRVFAKQNHRFDALLTKIMPPPDLCRVAA